MSFWYWGFVILVFLSSVVSPTHADPITEQKQDQVFDLPGQNFNVDFAQYAGYVTVNEENGRALFYWLTEATQDPASKPLVLWLNGGPGCSSIAYGMSEEVGPFHVDKDGKSVYSNRYSWNTVANLLFIDSPVGVGYSYSNTSSDIESNGDKRTAEDLLQFLLNWLERFPQYKGRDFYMTGESYAGHYVPQLSQVIVRYNKENTGSPVNLLGYMVGNALTDEYHDHFGLFQFMWTVGMISDQTYKKLNDVCAKSFYMRPSQECGQIRENIFQEIGNIDPYSIFTPSCTANNVNNRLLRKWHSGYIGRSYDPCTEQHSTIYFNLPEVQKALHVYHSNTSRRHVFEDDIDNGNDSIMGSIDDDVMSLRRHVFDDLDIVNIDEGRASICVPPKNALLLMRCRSDPMMMEALTNRFWEPNVEINEEEEEEVEEFVDEIIDQEHCDLEKFEVDQEIVELNMEIEMEESVQKEKIEQNVEMESIYVQDENDQENETIESNIEEVNEEDESMFLWCLFDEIQNQDEGFKDDDEEEEDAQLDMGYALELLFAIQDVQEFEAGESNIEKVKPLEEENDDMVTENETNERIVMESEKEENDVVVRENDERDKSIKELPECLLLMMYEPKLSMEVSKETWVCSSDFIRRHSSRKKPPQPQLPPVELINGQDESMVKCSSPTVTTQECDNNVMRIGAVQDQPVLHQPGRSSCSFPTRPLMATVLEEKLVNTMGYEPLVLTRCKSEPMRITEAKQKQDACYWKNKLEPPRRASFSISMAGLGF